MQIVHFKRKLIDAMAISRLEALRGIVRTNVIEMLHKDFQSDFPKEKKRTDAQVISNSFPPVA